MKKILCVCQANMGRSPMMEYLAESLVDNIEAESAGVKKEIAAEHNPPSKHAIRCMKEKGIDISNHRSRWVGNVDVRKFDLIFTVGEEEKREVKRLHGNETPEVVVLVSEGISDPHQQGLEYYRETRDVIEQALKDILTSRA